MKSSQKKNKNYHKLERIVRGFANHRRIQILEFLEKNPELSVIEITQELNMNFKTASEHIRRLAISGLIMKRSDGTNIRHELTERGLKVLKFLRTLE